MKKFPGLQDKGVWVRLSDTETGKVSFCILEINMLVRKLDQEAVCEFYL